MIQAEGRAPARALRWICASWRLEAQWSVVWDGLQWLEGEGASMVGEERREEVLAVRKEVFHRAL